MQGYDLGEQKSSLLYICTLYEFSYYYLKIFINASRLRCFSLMSPFLLYQLHSILLILSSPPTSSTIFTKSIQRPAQSE
ncbi:hypothetical protein GYMLUDRAFT_645890 [Collybiopsis luxurians FD-317 M1]|nr:hypothetical protein GYMLUDRAFT_645890 [Collybiopsis luxurians FD-317 M1]